MKPTPTFKSLSIYVPCEYMVSFPNQIISSDTNQLNEKLTNGIELPCFKKGRTLFGSREQSGFKEFEDDKIN